MTTYTMTLTDVQAWQVAADGSLPDEARALVEGCAGGHRVQYDRDDARMARDTAMAELIGQPPPSRRVDYWYWFSCDANQRASAGDWIVWSEYGVERMSDEQFRARCTEAGDA